MGWPAIDPTWLTWNGGTIRRMAQQMYGSRDFTAMPILADALEDAGCADERILVHCRLGARHTSSCWVINLILDKE